jgi:hypothetical protein
LRHKAKDTARAEGGDVDFLGAGSRGFLGFTDRSNLGRQSVAAVPHKAGHKEEGHNDDDGERGHLSTLVVAQADSTTVRCLARSHEVVPEL